MGAGLHGLNGVNPEVSVLLWNLYIQVIQPRLLYGLESIQLSRADISKLEKYQGDFLRQIQHLPERVAACSVYILSGLLPVEAEIHKSQLTLFGNIICQDCVERDLAIRQLAVKDLKSKSWFITIQETLFQYNLPSAHDLIENPPEKITWKAQVKLHIRKYWEKSIAEARLKSTLRYLNFENYQVGRVHELWSSAKCNQHSVYKSFVHLKISVGTYILQSNKARFNKLSSKFQNCVLSVTVMMKRWSISCCDVVNYSVREPFVRQVVLLLESTMDTTTRAWEGDDMVQLILDPTTVLSWCGTEDCQPSISCSQWREAYVMPCMLSIYLLILSRSISDHHLRCGVGG